MNRAIIFDLDGTIVLTERYHADAFSAALTPYSIDYTYDEHLKKYTGRGNQEIFRLKLKEANRPIALIPKLSLAKKQAYNHLLDSLGVPVVDGVEQFLQEAYNRKIVLAIATSTTRANAETLMSKTGLGKYFKVIVTRDDVKRAKPCPDIFIATAREIKAKPEETVVIEDSPRGIESASRATFATIGITTTSSQKALLTKGADLIIENYTKLELDIVLALRNHNLKMSKSTSQC